MKASNVLKKKKTKKQWCSDGGPGIIDMYRTPNTCGTASSP
jgi:hypothetical protein